MLHFFRKYQRIFFIFVTVAIVISFTFFGAYNSLAGSSEMPNVAVGRSLDGSPIMQRNLTTLNRLIASSPFDRDEGKLPNLLNDGVIQKDFIETGMGMILARRYFEELKPDLAERLAKVKRYRPYTHPQAPQIGTYAVWQRFIPELNQQLALLRSKSDQPTLESLALLFQIYLDQSHLPPHLLHQVLVYQQNQHGIPADPSLSQSDLSLFGFQTLEDWFGPRFVDLASQFLVNAAQVAEKNGYRVQREEVRADLFQNIVNGYQEVIRDSTIRAEDAKRYYQMQIHQLGLDEASVLQAWGQVMLFRRMFDDVSHSVFIDPLAFKQFHAFSKDSVTVDLYELPSALQLRDVRSVLLLQTYLEGISIEHARNTALLRLPAGDVQWDVVEKRAPELVELSMDVEFAVVHKEDLASAISVKQTWDWEIVDSNWLQLCKQFPELSQVKAKTASERFTALENLDGKMRLEIDRFARLCMLDQDPDRIALALARAPMQQASIGVRAKGGQLPFSGIQDQKALLELLQQAPIASKDYAPLEMFTQDGRSFHKITVIKRCDEKQVLSFSAAMRDGTLDQILDKKLEGAYPDVRRKNVGQFQREDGAWKPFIEVKDWVGRAVYADLLKAIESSYEKTMGAIPGKSLELPSVFYGQHRLLDYVASVQSDVIMANESPYAEQWKMVMAQRTIERSTRLPFAKEKIFATAENAWSSVEVGHAGALAFYRVTGKGPQATRDVNPIDKGHQTLALDVRRSLMVDLMDRIFQTKAIDINHERPL